MNEITFPLLSALATVEDMAGLGASQRAILEKLEELRKEISDKLPKIMEQSGFTEKSRLNASLNAALDDAAFLATFPDLLGKSCVAIIAADASADDLIANLALPDAALAPYCKNGALPYGMRIPVPQILVHADNGSTVKLMSHRSGYASLKDLPGHDDPYGEILSPQEYDAFLGLESDGILPGQIARAIVWQVSLKQKKSVYMILRPEDVVKSELSQLLNQCEAVIVYGTVTNQVCIDSLASSFHMPVYFLGGNQEMTNWQMAKLKNSFVGRKARLVPQADLPGLLRRLDGYIQRITLKDRIYCELLALLEDGARKKARSAKLVAKLDAMLNAPGGVSEEFNKTIQGLSVQHASNLKQLSQLMCDINAAIQAILQKAEAFEEDLQKFSNQRDGWHEPWFNNGAMRPETVWRRIILRTLESGDTLTASNYQIKFAEKFPEAAVITQLYKDRKTHGEVSHADLEHLRYMPDSQEVFRAKIFWRKELGLTEHDCAEIAGLMKRHQTEAEKYYHALHLREIYESSSTLGKESDVPFETLLQAYWDAILAGSEDAADELAMYCGGERLLEQTVEIASTCNTLAMYVAALLHHMNGDVAAKKRYMNMAAACGNEKALANSAEEIWQQRLKNKIRIRDGVMQLSDFEKLDASIKFYKILLAMPSMQEKIPALKERLGFYYYCRSEWIEAAKAIGENPQTTDAQFALAIMKRYGYGMKSDRSQSIKLIRQAEQGTGPCAILAANIKGNWLKNDLANIES